MATTPATLRPDGPPEIPGHESTKALAQRKALPPAMVATMQGLMPHVPALLPKDIGAEQFRAALFLELSGRPELQDCSQDSLRDCVIKSATYGLLPGRDCHFLPFKNKGGGGRKTATYVPNYFGIILALERTGKIRRAFAHPVHEGDVWEFDLFLDRPVHKPATTLGKKPGKELFYYGAIMFKDGTCAFEVLTLEDLDAIKKRAPAHESGPWVTDRVMMCRKSAIKRVSKYVKLTPEQRGLLEEDDERERQDIPTERHRQNVADLFGDAAAASIPDEKAPDVKETKNVTPKGKATEAPPAPAGFTWETLEAHRDDANLPTELLERVNAALSPLARATESEAHALANELLSYLDGQEA